MGHFAPKSVKYSSLEFGSNGHVKNLSMKLLFERGSSPLRATTTARARTLARTFARKFARTYQHSNNRENQCLSNLSTKADSLYKRRRYCWMVQRL